MLRRVDNQFVLEGPAGTLPIPDGDQATLKFAMLFEGQCEGLGPTKAAKKFGYSKQRYFQLLHRFKEHGIAGLQKQKCGPKTNYRRTDEVIRQVIRQLKKEDEVFLGELIWREFFMQILSHFPAVVDQNFNPRYNGLSWRNDEQDFERWCRGETGYPLVDAGMRQLNRTGYMHNRVRMVVASFLCKHL